MKTKPFSKTEADARLRAGDHRDDLLKRLPPDVDVDLAARAALELLEQRAWAFGRSCQQLPAAVIREVMARLDAEKSSDATRLFLVR